MLACLNAIQTSQDVCNRFLHTPRLVGMAFGYDDIRKCSRRALFSSKSAHRECLCRPACSNTVLSLNIYIDHEHTSGLVKMVFGHVDIQRRSRRAL